MYQEYKSGKDDDFQTDQPAGWMVCAYWCVCPGDTLSIHLFDGP